MIVSALVGLPQSGKTTILKLLSIPEIHEVATVRIPDERLEKVAQVTGSPKVTYASVEILDPPGSLDKGGAIFSRIQPAECLIVVVRCFDGGFGDPAPQRDAKQILETLLLFDFSSAETKLKTTESALSKGHSPEEKKELEQELASLRKFIEAVESGKPIRAVISTTTDERLARNQGFLSAKKWLCAANFEDSFNEQVISDLEKILLCPVFSTSAKIETEIQQLSRQDSEVFRREFRLPENSPLERFSEAMRKALDIVTFFTANEKEARAWAVPKGSNAISAAGKIHSDIARGFIRAEVIEWDKLVQCGSYQTARTNALIRSEGKDYIIQDGDVILFRFNV